MGWEGFLHGDDEDEQNTQYNPKIDQYNPNLGVDNNNNRDTKKDDINDVPIRNLEQDIGQVNSDLFKVNKPIVRQPRQMAKIDIEDDDEMPINRTLEKPNIAPKNKELNKSNSNSTDLSKVDLTKEDEIGINVLERVVYKQQDPNALPKDDKNSRGRGSPRGERGDRGRGGRARGGERGRGMNSPRGDRGGRGMGSPRGERGGRGGDSPRGERRGGNV